MKFYFKNIIELDDNNLNKIKESYRKFFAELKGNDIIDSLLKLTKKDIKDINNKEKILKLSDNYIEAINVINELKNNEEMKLLCIYNNKDEMMGIARIVFFNLDEASISEILLFNESSNDKKIMEYTIIFIENYLKDNSYKKLYIEIPFFNPFIQYIDELGFKEDEHDLELSEEEMQSKGINTYLLHKELKK